MKTTTKIIIGLVILTLIAWTLLLALWPTQKIEDRWNVEFEIEETSVDEEIMMNPCQNID